MTAREARENLASGPESRAALSQHEGIKNVPHPKNLAAAKQVPLRRGRCSGCINGMGSPGRFMARVVHAPVDQHHGYGDYPCEE